jgi:hypothetical protein
MVRLYGACEKCSPEPIIDKDAEIARLRAELASARLILDQVATEDAAHRDEIARLREVLNAVRGDLAPIHMCNVVHTGCKICEVLQRIYAALATSSGLTGGPPEGKGE